MLQLVLALSDLLFCQLLHLLNCEFSGLLCLYSQLQVYILADREPLTVVALDLGANAWIRRQVQAKQAAGVSQGRDKSAENLRVEAAVVQLERLNASVVPNQLAEAEDHLQAEVVFVFGFSLSRSHDVPQSHAYSLSSLLHILVHGGLEVKVELVVLVAFVDEHVAGEVEYAQGAVVRQDFEEVLEVGRNQVVPREVQVFQVAGIA